MKKSVRNLVTLLLAGLILGFSGCEMESDDSVSVDTTPPAKVTVAEDGVTAANGKAVLTWTNPTDDDFYATRLTVSPAVENGNSSLVIEGNAGEKSSASFEGLVNGTEYTFKLYSLDNNHNVSEAVEVTAKPESSEDFTSPSEVSELKVTSAVDGNAVLTWTNPTDSDFSGVKLSMTPAEGTLVNPVILDKGVSTFTVSGLTNGIEYTFKIQTFDESLNYSEGKTEKAIPVDTSDKTAPADVTGLTITAANGNAILSWTNPAEEDFSGVKITMTPAEGTLVNPVTLDKGVSTFTVSGLTNGTEYTFKVQSFDDSLNFAKGESEGATAKATPTDTSDKTAPADVTGLTITAANGNAVLSWTNPTDSDFFGVKITMTPAEGTLVNPVTFDKGVSTFTVSGLTNGTEYTFKVQSFDDSLNFAKGESEGATAKANPQDTSDKTAPAEVTNLSVSCVNGKDGKVNAVLTWTDPSDIDLFGMEVTYVKNSNSRAAIAPMAEGSIFVAPGNGGLVITDLTAGTNYTFTVKTMDTNGNKSNGKSESATMSLSQLGELKITLTPSTTEITNEDVTVTVKAESSSTVSKIYYVSGIKTSVDDVLKGTEITTATSFTATENGTYTVVAVDYDGRREISYITIENIDKTAPNAPTNLAASYDYGKKTITLTWNTNDSDVDHYLVSYTKAETDVVKDEKVTEKTYTLSNVEVGDTAEVYAFTVKAVDKAGNTGSESTASITPKAAPLVSKIELSRTHFAYKEAGTTFTATVYGSNFDLISDQTDTTVKVQILDSDGNVESTTTATSVDTTSNTATATLILPTLTSSTAAGTNYTVRAKVCGSIDKEHTTTFNISEAAEVTDVTLSTSLISVNSVTSDTKTKATVTGTNLDLAKTITLFLYDSTGKKYGEEVSVDLTKFTQSTASFDIDLPVPTVDDLYKVRVVLEGWTYRSKTTSLQVYGLPAFTSFDIPNAGTVKEDNTVTATVIGKNFTAPGVSATDFSLSCASNKNIVSDPNITIESDSKLTVTLTIPGTVGSYDVVIASGNNSMTGTFTVKDSKGYALGDVILKDGTKVDAKAVSSTTFATTGDKVPVAVAVVNENGVGICFLGLKKSSSSLSWAKENTTGYNTSFTDIIGWRGGGDMDGSDNWEYICSEDPEGTKDAATNYPAFDFAANYGTTTCGFDENDEFASGWYIPSASELYEIYKCKDTLQTSLNNVGGFTIAKTDMYSYRYQYWSSSQSSNYFSYAYYVDFSSGDVGNGDKYSNDYVLVVRAF